MPREPGAHIEPADLRPLPDDGVAVECVDRVEPGPRPGNVELVEGGKVFDEFRPDPVEELAAPNREIEPDEVIGKRPGDEELPVPLGEHIQPRRQEHARKITLPLQVAVDDEHIPHEGQHREVDTDAGQQRWTPGTGAVDDDGRPELLSGDQTHTNHAVTVTNQLGNLTLHEIGAHLDGALPIAAEHRVRIDRAIARSEGPADVMRSGENGPPGCDLGFIDPTDIATQCLLRLHPCQGVGPVLEIGQEQIALMPGTGLGPIPADLHIVGKGRQHVECILGDPDILFEVELDTDVAVRENR